jgi:hypothetical protein
LYFFRAEDTAHDLPERYVALIERGRANGSIEPNRASRSPVTEAELAEFKEEQKEFVLNYMDELVRRAQSCFHNVQHIQVALRLVFKSLYQFDAPLCSIVCFLKLVESQESLLIPEL